MRHDECNLLCIRILLQGDMNVLLGLQEIKTTIATQTKVHKVRD
jgi:hypothetical protein